MSEQTIWPDGIPGGYHDVQCRCPGHCGNCYEDLDEIRELRARMAAEGQGADFPQLGPKERYCSPYCRNRAKRERALDRALAAAAVKETSGA